MGARLRFRSDGKGVGLLVALGRTDPKNRRACCLRLGISANSDVCVGGLGVYALFGVFKVRAE